MAAISRLVYLICKWIIFGTKLMLVQVVSAHQGASSVINKFVDSLLNICLFVFFGGGKKNHCLLSHSIYIQCKNMMVVLPPL